MRKISLLLIAIGMAYALIRIAMTPTATVEPPASAPISAPPAAVTDAPPT